MIKHNLSKTRIDYIWKHIIQRCTNPNNKAYDNYGGRGITICDEWRNNSKAFFDWAFSNGYKDNLTIDRIDNNKGYCPENCRWVTKQQNIWNKRPKPNAASQYKGVTWNKRYNKWLASLKHNQKNMYLGLFESEKEAALVYDQKAKEIYGEFAYLNFPDEQ